MLSFENQRLVEVSPVNIRVKKIKIYGFRKINKSKSLKKKSKKVNTFRNN